MSEKLTPQQRALHARLAAHSRWAKEDPVAGTAKARLAAEARFYVGIPEDLPQGERDRRAASARKAYFTGLALKSAQARSKSGAA